MEATRSYGSHSLRFRLGVVALVFLAMVLVAVGLSTLMLRSWDRTLNERSEARTVADLITDLRLAYSDQETGIRGFQLSADPSALRPYDQGRVLADRVGAALDAREIEIDGFADQLDVVRAAGAKWRTEVAEPAVDGSAVDPETALQSFDQLRAELDLLERLVRSELSELVESERNVRRNAFGVLFASALVAITGTVLAALLFRRWVIQPLDAISDAARALADDDDDHPIPRFDAPELDAVSTAIGTLQRSLRRARDEAVASYDALEQSAVLAIQVRSELADELGEMPQGWHVSTLLEPAQGVVAGDCFDIGLLDGQRMYVVLIDVTGHGAPAALNALKAKSRLRAALRNRRDPGAAIDWMSREMLNDANTELLTASVMVIDLRTGVIRYANAGHPPALITDGTTVELLEQPGPIVGAFDATWTTGTAELPPGWTLLVHTDGITETLGPDRERFGDERLVDCLSTADADAMLGCIRDAVDDFRFGAPTDDVTAIAIHRNDDGTRQEVSGPAIVQP